jgi:lysophospholipase L1-like esterase
VAEGRRLSFAGRPDSVIPPGGEIWSDPIAMPLTRGADLTVSLYLPAADMVQTGHPGARGTNFFTEGDQLLARHWPNATPVTRWYAISDIEVDGEGTEASVVAIGDSITDGFGVTSYRNTRWSDVLAQRLRLAPSTRGIGVLNAGIGGNRILLDGLGPNLVARFDRDVIARTGVRWAILLEGVNDLGSLSREGPRPPERHAALVRQITDAYRQLAQRAHAHGIRVFGGTITPFTGNDYYRPDAAIEADRQAVNHFIRTAGVFDAVIDFDKLLRDPAHPERLLPDYDSGDHLHPSENGYRVMGQAVPLALFRASRSGAGRSLPDRPAD